MFSESFYQIRKYKEDVSKPKISYKENKLFVKGLGVEKDIR